MRISEQERKSIVSTAKEFFGAGCIVRIFGSRADDQARGGDIDLHIVAERHEMATLERELRFLVRLKELIGDQKIDTVVQSPAVPDRPIDEVAKEKGVSL